MIDKELERLAREKGIDVAWLGELVKEVPRGGNVPGEVAAILKVKFWVGVTNLTDSLTVARRLLNESKADRDQYFANRKLASEEKSEAAKTREAEADNKYQEYCRMRSRVEELVQFLTDKRSEFVMAHYMMKDIVKRELEDRIITPPEEMRVEV